MRIIRLLPILFFAFLIGCKERTMDQSASSLTRLESIPQELWDSLSEKKIFFGHQSVGLNIISGLRDVMESYPPARMDILETSDPAEVNAPGFAHWRVGRNMDPQSKIDHFQEIMENGMGHAVDIALFKLCYVDIRADTDIDEIYRYYDKAIADLENKFPKLKIITFSVPLMINFKGIKTTAKRILGRMPWSKEDNIKRNNLNDLLRRRFGNSLFDLAHIESISPDGKTTTFKKSGTAYVSLSRAYTDDGGHLNEAGGRMVAAELLSFLAALAKD